MDFIQKSHIPALKKIVRPGEGKIHELVSVMEVRV